MLGKPANETSDEDQRPRRCPRLDRWRHNGVNAENDDYEAKRRPRPKLPAEAGKTAALEREPERDHDAKPADDVGKFAAGIPRGEKPRNEKRDVGYDDCTPCPLQGSAAVEYEKHQHRARSRNCALEERGRPRQRVDIYAAFLRKRHKRHADRPERRRRCVGDKAHHDRLHRVKPDPHENRSRNRHRRSEAGHALHEVAETPDNEKREDAPVVRHLG